MGGKKKKWSKGKTKEKVNNEVMYTQAAYDKMLVEVPKMKMITPSILSDRLRINGSLILPSASRCFRVALARDPLILSLSLRMEGVIIFIFLPLEECMAALAFCSLDFCSPM